MARRGPATIQEELYSTPGDSAREEIDDARLLDLDAEKESPFLRAQKRVPARRSALPKKTATRILWATLAIILAAIFAFGAMELYRHAQSSSRFELNSSDDIELAGLTNVNRAQVMEVMGGDIGRNVFFIPLDERQKQLQQIPWVESASVMRFAPDRIKIQIKERTPVAFAQIGSKVMLADAGGVLMDLSAKKKYSFPVILGMGSNQPLSTRSEQMKIYNRLVRELDSSGGHYSQELSEVDLSDPEDVKVLTNDSDGEVLVHLGSSNYLDRYKVYVAHLREWRQRFPALDSVDLRYGDQIVVNPDLRGAERQPTLSAKEAKAAIAAGVKPAALVERAPAKARSGPAPVKSAPKTITVSKKAWSKAPPAKSQASAWHKRPVHAAAKKSKTAAHHVVGHPALHDASSTTKAPPEASGKPSPAIAKGQDIR